MAASQKMFPALNPDEDVDNVTVLESYCGNCEQNGETRLLLTNIPFFREVIVMAFNCEHCGYRENRLQAASELGPKVVKYVLSVNHEADSERVKRNLNRQIVRSDYATMNIPEIEFEIPANCGEINTVEGILETAVDGLTQTLPLVEDTDIKTKLVLIVSKLRQMASGEESFTFILEDIAGQSFLENPNAPAKDDDAFVEFRERTDHELNMIGYATEEKQPKKTGAKGSVSVAQNLLSKLDTYFDVTSQAATIPGECHSCHSTTQCETRMCVVDLPYFKEVVIMVSDCTGCGYRDCEVKPAGAVSKKGKIVILKVKGVDDLKRDVLKSDSCGITIPEMELELESGSLGGKYTTIEGLIGDIEERLKSAWSFQLGDSATEQSNQIADFMKKFEAIKNCEYEWTLVLKDPLGNIFIGTDLPGGVDPQIQSFEYDRSEEENEILGLNDMVVDDYQAIEEEPEQEEQEQEQVQEEQQQ